VEQVELANLIGTNDMGALTKHMSALRMRDPGPFERSTDAGGVAAIQAKEPRRLVPDPAGFLVVYPDALRCVLVVEHYTTHGVLDCIIEGRTPAAVSSEAIERGLLTRLDHAAYLGRELAVAERSMRTGERYVQDRAPGELVEEAAAEPGCGCATVTACGETK
jgi:tetrahydromethanopterin S-methyltransferase subunit A